MRNVANKWSKFAVLMRHSGVAKHIPTMRVFNPANLQWMLQRFSFIVAKPFVGTGGHRVVKITKDAGGYVVQYYGSRTKVHSLSQLAAKINRIRQGRRFMLQQGISLTTIHSRPLDYRVKLVKVNRKWAIRAVVGRLARPGLFVTNLCQGGTMLKGSNALRQTFPKSLVKSKIATMCGVARTCTFLLESHYPGIGALGYDFGIDRQGRVWILEVNTRPH
ncbi:YheC/YheD family protein [Paenibacillus thalictri]|uniref:YheC/YheD family protein n=1 Tax=Paenibacillus thalictri TaxID=2527873 RepID=UPI0013EF1D10|nr:YheC/YheD family protein [Paenibacillus thalictri]